MARATIDRLIINSPYEEPQRHWRYDRETRLFDLEDGWPAPGGLCGGLWRWGWALAHHPGEIKDILLKRATPPKNKRNG